MTQYVNILLLTLWTWNLMFLNQQNQHFFKAVLLLSVHSWMHSLFHLYLGHFECRKSILNTNFRHNSVKKFISHGNIIFVTLKMHYFRWCDSWCRAGFFSRIIYCGPIQPWPNILSLGVTTISMIFTLHLTYYSLINKQKNHFSFCIRDKLNFWRVHESENKYFKMFAEKWSPTTHCNIT